MYKPTTCFSKCHRLQTDDRETLENVKDEMRYLFTLHDRSFGHDCPKTVHIDYHRLLRDPDVIFNIGRKLWCQAEDVLNVDSANVNINDVQSYIIELLVLTRRAFTRCGDNLSDSFTSCFELLKKFVTPLTDIHPSSVQKLVGRAVKRQDDPIAGYFHLYLDVLWLLFTVDDARGIGDVKQVVVQLAFITLKSFQRHKGDFINCKCLKSIWLRLQLFCENKGLRFWDVFNSVLECHDDEFVMCLLPFVARLQCYDKNGSYVGTGNGRVCENFDLLCSRWDLLMKNYTDEAKLLTRMESMHILMWELWSNVPRLGLLYSTWDHFYRKIDEVSLDGDLLSILELVKGNTRLTDSYLFFLRILRRHFVKHPQHWNKFKGRVYTRFSSAKFAKLSDRGVFNLTLLFLSICDTSFDEINGTIIDLLDSLSHERKNTSVVWKIYIALIEVNLRRNKSIVMLAKKFMPLVEETSADRSQFHLVSLLTSKLHTFITNGEISVHLEQPELFGPWIENFVKSCQLSELTNFLHVLIVVLERVNEADVWYEYETAFTVFVLPTLKKLALETGATSLIGTVAGLIVAYSTREESVSVIAYFASENVSPKVMCAFFSALARSLRLPSQADPLILKAWFQCALIGESTVDFDRFAFALNLTRKFNLGSLSTLPDFLHILGANSDREVSKACFEGIDRWLVKQLNVDVECVTELVYFNMAMTFTTCGHLLYSRSLVTCPLSKLIDLLLLPTAVLRGLRPCEIVMKSVEKYWNLYVTAVHGLSNGDPYLERVFKDLIVRYIPHFQTKRTPLLDVMNEHGLAAAVLSKINNEYLLQNANGGEFTYKVLSALNNLLGNIGRLTTASLIVTKLLPAVFEAYMFKNQKLASVEAVKLMIDNRPYRNGEFKMPFVECLRETTRKHLPFNTSSYFQLMYVLTKIIPEEIRAALIHVRHEIKVVESKRGQGCDHCLRSSFDKLQKLLE